MSPLRVLFLLAGGLSLFGQAGPGVLAGRMLSELDRTRWNAPYAGGPACRRWTPYQLAIYATDQWSYHCAATNSGLTEESFFYVFEGLSGPVRLRVDLRPENETSDTPGDAELYRVLAEDLTRRYGASTREPELFEIGFRHLRYGEPVAGDHWQSGQLHYFLHRNQTNQMPLGMRRGVELIVFENRLMDERTRDAFIQKVDGICCVDPVRSRLQREVKENPDQTYGTLMDLLRQSNQADRETKARLLLQANELVTKLSGALVETDSTAAIRKGLASFGIRLGAMTHDGGLYYNQDLLWRVWDQFPDTGAGETAFVELQNRGWNTEPGPGCPAHPDLFRGVIERGEAFLARHPQTRYRKEVLFTLATAHESWWSIARAPASDGIVADIPYPRKALNRQSAAGHRTQAIRYYRELLALAPDSPEAASAHRRLPRLELNLDTGQRRFFCYYD